MRLAQRRQAYPSAALLEKQPSKTPDVPGGRGMTQARESMAGSAISSEIRWNCCCGGGIHTANIQAREDANRGFWRAKGEGTRLKRLWADGISRDALGDGRLGAYPLWLGSGARHTKHRGNGVQVLPKRWIVARTFPGLGSSRTVSQDSAGNPQTTPAFILAARTYLMIRRLATKPLGNQCCNAA